ncbi:hypothetical protein A0H81_05787 [Grifola frondosa]|uniref:CxC2-like cysteine cluster KDZ transposase-associated domain-containing protein n=1 Tax=Grifola frondosa TaxID=5627 RepID=A0A1C7MC78_GRIFR|nr:hypothetical protein A0H81_05787 [Grifola frondosa]
MYTSADSTLFDDVILGSNIDDTDTDAIYDLSDYLDDFQHRKRTPGDDPLGQWVPHIDEYLDELMRLEGHGDYQDSLCPVCGIAEATLRCSDCDDLRLLCAGCTISRHLANPVHRVSVWTGTYFQQTSLKALGLRVQLGHPPGERCLNPAHAFADDFVLLDSNGIHEIGLDFSTSDQPKTAATFRLLETFHLLSVQTKISGFEFYSALARRTDNTGVEPVKDRYPSFMRMVREWRHLKMLKRAGRGLDPGGVSATQPGGCAVLCTACPHPGVNIPPNWKDATKKSMDANFRLKRKKVSSHKKDPGLNHGYAYVVEENAYKSHLSTFSDLIPRSPMTATTTMLSSSRI